MRLINTESSEICIACYQSTNQKVSCCNAPICEKCYFEWLKVKRQCMHCKADQCEFDVWVSQYRVEPQFDPNEYLQMLLQTQTGTLNTEPILVPGGGGFGLDTMLHAIQQTMNGGSPPLVLEGLEDFPTTGEPFIIEYGYTVTPEGGGQGVTVTQQLDYNGDNADLHRQVLQTLQEYQQLFMQNVPRQPWIEDNRSGSDSDVPHDPYDNDTTHSASDVEPTSEYILDDEPPPEWPWGNSD